MRGCGANPEAAREPHRVPTQENDDALAQITRILAAAGEANPLDVLMPLVHQDLRRLARAQRRQMEPGETLSTTALVHEAYLKLGGAQLAAQDRNHLLALSARAMRQVLVDDARARKADKRGGGQDALTLGAADVAGEAAAVEVLKLDELLQSLHRLDERAAQIVELRYFGGYTEVEVADMLAISESTLRRDWRRARAFLMKETAA